ncbi:class II glutamine amidotransferase [Candidatus Desantisbacteria bacterium CG_4_10_14_0_8_um_filter_48_22]|uniref:Class II glutamine amidotransferase n=1 Tax=Candidatus Desantisbacteria bacterium CG_4_10_14_0_8_um_filter_48_22 TaxID=1974543 RepID=A0A2M7SDR4_9BACT|nr:MAG: hypothetical protein AUJ67_09395 [Candidatus Desantisbacteria bacterium CG1_02_49_89]PIV56749.1 MAG: class II glutamine amidotransferase [Candidatus Desantisbacteria bacterium CG02_land_8_20_14_3_00_49_13]PIZ17675.1 MAG: class II glutamine amidotransferase [Candidatus Desantisbacteria bacterium CG_4_10_14_0_8_um_filter_48_22]
MCRLFGIMANREVDIDFSFYKADKPFKSFSRSNPDGWGIGYYKNGKAEVFKEGLDDVEKYDFNKIEYIKSNIVISHVRKAAQYGGNSSKNAHPFKYKNWIFAHNGVVKRERILECLDEEYKQELTSENDTEIYFRLLLQEINRSSNVINGIKTGIKIVKEQVDYTGLNFVMSDGETLYAYRDASENKNYYSLYFLERKPQKGKEFNFKSKATNQLMHSKCLLGEKAVLFCSEKMTEEEWQEIELGKLFIVDPKLEITKIKL